MKLPNSKQEFLKHRIKHNCQTISDIIDGIEYSFIMDGVSDKFEKWFVDNWNWLKEVFDLRLVNCINIIRVSENGNHIYTFFEGSVVFSEVIRIHHEEWYKETFRY